MMGKNEMEKRIDRLEKDLAEVKEFIELFSEQMLILKKQGIETMEMAKNYDKTIHNLKRQVEIFFNNMNNLRK